MLALSKALVLQGVDVVLIASIGAKYDGRSQQLFNPEPQTLNLGHRLFDCALRKVSRRTYMSSMLCTETEYQILSSGFGPTPNTSFTLLEGSVTDNGSLKPSWGCPRLP